MMSLGSKAKAFHSFIDAGLQPQLCSCRRMKAAPCSLLAGVGQVCVNRNFMLTCEELILKQLIPEFLPLVPKGNPVL